MRYHLGRPFGLGLNAGPVVICPYCDVAMDPGEAFCTICKFAPPPAPKPRNCTQCRTRWQPKNARHTVCDKCIEIRSRRS